MQARPVSFGSIMVTTLNDGKPKATVPEYIRAAFNNNEKLKRYYLQSDIYVHNEKKDGTVYNASTNFAELLDKKHEKELPKGSKKVIMSEVDFFVSPTKTEKKYFLTAPTGEDEEKILKILGGSTIFYAARFGPKAV
ncbi:hypothetical protein II906_11485 [bacterium]|nr:hypothetical protein [bacterium]